MADPPKAYPPDAASPPYPSTGGAPYPSTGGTPYPGGAGGAPYPNAPGGAPPAYQPQIPQQPQQTQIVVQQVFQEAPVQVQCPNCHNNVQSVPTYQVGLMTWLVMGILLILGFWAGCFLIPLCIDGLKDVHHTCPVCNYHLGKYERLKF